MLKKLIFLWLFFATLSVHWSCTKPLDDNKYIDPYPVSIKVESFIDGNEITWTPIKSADFVSYRIWRSTTQSDTISNKPNLNSSTGLSVITTITDTEKSSFSDISVNSSTTLSPAFYYRVETVLKNRSIWSRNFLVANSFVSDLNESIGSIKSDKSKKEIYLLSSNTNNIYVYNTDKSAITSVIPITKTNFSSNSFASGKVNGRNELYVAVNKDIYIVDVEQKKIIETITLDLPFSNGITNLSTNDNGKLFISLVSNGFMILDRNNNNSIVEVATNTEGSNPFKIFNIPNENLLLGVEANIPYKIVLYRTNNDKSAVLNKAKEVVPPSSYFASTADMSKNFILNTNTYLISGRGFIYDKNLDNSLFRMLNSINTFATTTHLFKDFQALDKDRYVSVSSTSVSSFTINSWKSPNNMVKEKFISGLGANGIALFDDDIWVVANNFNTNKTIIRKYKY